MNLETDSTHKESTLGEIERLKQQIAGFAGSLNDYGDPFRGAA